MRERARASRCTHYATAPPTFPIVTAAREVSNSAGATPPAVTASKGRALTRGCTNFIIKKAADIEQCP